MPTQDKHPSYIRSTGQINLPTRQFINSSTQKLKKHQLINSKNTNSSTQKTPTHQLKKHQHVYSKNTSTSTQKTPARLLKKSRNLQLTSFPTHQLESLNYYFLFYNIAPNFAPF